MKLHCMFRFTFKGFISYTLIDVHNPGNCVDDPATNCTHMSNLINICSDILHAKNVCRKHCGLCSLG